MHRIEFLDRRGREREGDPELFSTPESQALVGDIDTTTFFKEFGVRARR